MAWYCAIVILPGAGAPVKGHSETDSMCCTMLRMIVAPSEAEAIALGQLPAYYFPRSINIKD